MRPEILISLLREKIRYHNHLYYVLDSPEVSDKQYDDLMVQLKKLEEEHPELITPDSPTQKVGASISNEFLPVKHLLPMLSLDNSYSKEDIIKWFDRTKKTLDVHNFETIAEAKIDGLSCSLIYKDSILTTAVTRGDGETGEDVTANVKTIIDVPLVLKQTIKGTLEVRGEVFMYKSAFEKLNDKQVQQGQEPFANPRNAAAGSLRQKDSSVTAKRSLSFFAHSHGFTNLTDMPLSHSTYIALYRLWGFKICPVHKRCQNIDEVIQFCNAYEQKRTTLDYAIDGIVVKVNEIAKQETLGTTARSPRWAIAYKYPADRATTRLKNVIFSVGRTGVITPVAELEPVECNGVMISSATLHNFDEIKRLGIMIGDMVDIERAGDVIPKVVRAVISARRQTEEPIKEPVLCPACEHKLVKDEDAVAIRCVNPLCPAQLKEHLKHFGSRNAMDINGLGEAVADQLVEKGYVRIISDLYTLEKAQLMSLDLVKDKKADNLLKSISDSRKQPLSRLMFGLGIRHIGEKNAQVLAARFKTMDNLLNASAEDFNKVPDIGPKASEALYNFFHDKTALQLINNLRTIGCNFEENATETSGKLNGVSFVFTGELKTLTRAQAKAKVLKLGGKETSAVSAKTGYVVVGEAPGSKLAKAQKLNIPTFTEEEFIKFIDSHSAEPA